MRVSRYFFGTQWANALEYIRGKFGYQAGAEVRDAEASYIGKNLVRVIFRIAQDKVFTDVRCARGRRVGKSPRVQQSLRIRLWLNSRTSSPRERNASQPLFLRYSMGECPGIYSR